jgi:hypothetical protein
VSEGARGVGGGSSTITVSLVNGTDKGVDPTLHVAPVADGTEALFDAGNKRADYGSGNAGILAAGEAVEVTLACDAGAPVYVGVAGAKYGDDLASPAATGRQIVLEQGVGVSCGDTVTIMFSVVGGTALITSHSVAPQRGG